MKKAVLVLLAAFLSAGMLFAGGWEIKTGVSYESTTSMHTEGEATSFKDDLGIEPATISFPVEIKYIAFPGLELKLEAEYAMDNEDSYYGAVKGFKQPKLGVKYMTEMGFGASVDVALPFGTEDMVGPEPAVSFDLAAVYSRDFAPVYFMGMAMYNFNMEDASKAKQDGFGIYLEPAYEFTYRTGVYLGLEYWKVMDAAVDGKKIADTNSYYVTLYPGAWFYLSRTVILGLDTEIVVARDAAANSEAYGSWKASLSATFLF